MIVVLPSAPSTALLARTRREPAPGSPRGSADPHQLRPPRLGRRRRPSRTVQPPRAGPARCPLAVQPVAAQTQPAPAAAAAAAPVALLLLLLLLQLLVEGGHGRAIQSRGSPVPAVRETDHDARDVIDATLAVAATDERLCKRLSQASGRKTSGSRWEGMNKDWKKSNAVPYGWSAVIRTSHQQPNSSHDTHCFLPLSLTTSQPAGQPAN